MIVLKKLNKDEIIVNADLIESIESIPETLITLTTGRKLTVRDPVEDVVKRIIRYKQLTHQTVQVVPKQK